MINALFCPNLLIANITADPLEFEKEHIAGLLSAFQECEIHSIRPIILQETCRRYIEGQPWNMMEDPQWKMLLMDWMSSIYPRLEKATLSFIAKTTTIACAKLIVQTNIEKDHWHTLLADPNSIIQTPFPSFVLATSNCDQSACHVHRTATNGGLNSATQLILYPWLAIYDSRLPVGGEWPFIPPKNWERSGKVVRGLQHGYIDASGREWVHDTERCDHWDVQLEDGTHQNVNYNGDMIS